MPLDHINSATFPVEHNLKYAVLVEDGAFIARCLDVEVTSEGNTREEAIANLQEALELYFEKPSPTARNLFPLNGMRYANMGMPEIIAEWAQELNVDDDDEQLANFIGANAEAIARWKKLETRPAPSMLEQYRLIVNNLKERLKKSFRAAPITLVIVK